MNSSVRAKRDARGFSTVELLVTIVLARVMFAAMVPVFAVVLRRKSADNFRVSASSIAQDRIETDSVLRATRMALGLRLRSARR